MADSIVNDTLTRGTNYTHTLASQIKDQTLVLSTKNKYVDKDIEIKITGAGAATRSASATQVGMTDGISSTATEYYVTPTATTTKGIIDANSTNGTPVYLKKASVAGGTEITADSPVHIVTISAGYTPGETITINRPDDAEFTGGTTEVNGENVTRGVYTNTAGYVSATTTSAPRLAAATFSNEATTGHNYVDISNTSASPALAANGFLYINKGYTDDLKISLAKLIKDDATLETVNASGTYTSSKIRKGSSAYDNDGHLVQGSMEDVVRVAGVTTFVESNYLTNTNTGYPVQAYGTVSTETGYVEKGSTNSITGTKYIVAAATPSLTATDNTNNVTVGTYDTTKKKYPLTNSITAKTSYGTAGWIPTTGLDAATDSSVNVGYMDPAAITTEGSVSIAPKVTIGNTLTGIETVSADGLTSAEKAGWKHKIDISSSQTSGLVLNQYTATAGYVPNTSNVEGSGSTSVTPTVEGSTTIYLKDASLKTGITVDDLPDVNLSTGIVTTNDWKATFISTMTISGVATSQVETAGYACSDNNISGTYKDENKNVQITLNAYDGAFTLTTAE